MRMLLLTSCGAQGVVALADDTAVLAEQQLPGRGSGEALLPALRRLFAETGWMPGELTAVAVVDGPGSFTGIRVGLSAAKGLADAAGCGLVAISRLWLLAAGTEQPLALLDAGRGEVFAGWFDEGQWRERLLNAQAAAGLAAGRTALACEAQLAERLRGSAGELDRPAQDGMTVLNGVPGSGQAVTLRLVEEPQAHAIWTEALRRIRDGQWSDAATADANYLRRTDAELVADTAEARG